MAAITPDPWHVRHLQADGRVIRIEGYEIITPAYDVVAGNPGVAPIRNKADAYLIAQSRNMYNLLKVMEPPITEAGACAWCGALSTTCQDKGCPWKKSRDILSAVDLGSD